MRMKNNVQEVIIVNELYKEIAINILDEFENFLEEKGVNIVNPEKAESDNPAILYGTDYGELEECIIRCLEEIIG